MFNVLLLLVACSGSPSVEATPAQAPEAVAAEAPAPAAAEPAPAEDAAAEPAPDEDVAAEPETPPEAEPPAVAPPAPKSAPPTNLEAGAACLTADQCQSGVCEGMGCDDQTPGVCAPSQRACTRDRRAFCGCDGKQFYGSSSCVGQRYAYKGMCDKKTL